MDKKLDKKYNGIENKKIIDSIWKKMPILAKKLIEETQDLSNENNIEFLNNPDELSCHQPNWHQWGIITHTKMLEKFYNKKVPKYLEKWGIKEKINKYLSQRIDNKTKDELIRIAIIFHDLGKFSQRKINYKEDNTVFFSFGGHEIASASIIRSQGFTNLLKKDYLLTDKQIEYIAKCAELHYELGKARDMAKKTNLGYTLRYSKSNQAKESMLSIMDENKDYQAEIGILFLADSLAKTDIYIKDSNDQEIESQTLPIQKLLQQKNMNPLLLNAIKQRPVNIKIAETYLLAIDK